jgi:hypothetical protein
VFLTPAENRGFVFLLISTGISEIYDQTSKIVVYENINALMMTTETFISLTGLVAGQNLYNFARRFFTSLVF